MGWWSENYTHLMVMIGLQFIYAGAALFAKEALVQGVSPMVFVVYRLASATLALAPPSILKSRRRRGGGGGGGGIALGIKGFTLLFVAAFVGVTLNQFLYYQGLDLASATLASATTNTMPAFTFLIAAAVGLEKVDIRSSRSMAKVLGTAVCVGGAICMAVFKGPQLMTPNITTQISNLYTVEGENWMIGCIFLLGSSFCWSIWLILQVPICRGQLDPLTLSTWMCLFAFLQSAVLTFFLESDLNAWRLGTSFQLWAAIYAGVFGSGIACIVQSWSISRRGPLFSSIFSPLYTVIVTVLANLFLQEHLYLGSSAGAAAAMVGLYIVLWGKAQDYGDKARAIPVSTDQETSNVNEPLIVHSKSHDHDDDEQQQSISIVAD